MLHSLTQPIVFCDVETTGGSAKFNRITEIACIRYEAGIEVDRFVSLINPETPIPYNIQMITGIDNTMVEEAPYFSAVAKQIEEIFAGAIFCAHNVRFDYNFIAAEMSRAGFMFAAPKLCTVQISRALYPDERGHGLSKIIERFGFDCDARHRALGDTEVLVQFAKHLAKEFDAATLAAVLKKHSTNVTLPPNVTSSLLSDIPHEPGVYFFYGKDDELLYVGKSINIYKRLLSHFSQANHNTRAAGVWNETHRIETKTTASGLGASLLELHYIKTLQPILNKRSRKTKKLWGLFLADTRSNYTVLQLKPFTNLSEEDSTATYGIFKTKQQAIKALQIFVKEKGLCPYLLGIESGKGACFSHQLGTCRGACIGSIDATIYNILLEQAFTARKIRIWPYQGNKELTFTNTTNNKTEQFVINNWLLTDATLYADHDVEEFITPETTFDYEMYKVLAPYL